VKRIGIRDLKNRATQLLREDEVLLIQRHGKDVGVYLPLSDLDEAPLEVRLRLFQRVTDEIGRAARRRRVTEAGLLRRFRALRRYRRSRGH
jgi:hypothetical protein